MRRLEVLSPDGVPEVAEGDDLVDLLLAALTPDESLRDGTDVSLRDGTDVSLRDGTDVSLRDGDIVVVTSKVVSKAEGRLVAGDRDAALAGETVRVVARRGPTTIVRSRLGLTMAAAGIDASNVPAGHVALLPVDPDASARRLRERIATRAGARVGVVVSDTSGRAWRHGQTDIAIGAAGLVVAAEHAGLLDPHGHALAVTLPAVADEVAAAAELAGGKLAGRPYAVLRGRADLVLPADDHGPGAASLVREEDEDLFGFGAREAVVRALAAHPGDRAPFGAPADLDEVLTALATIAGDAETVPGRVAAAACFAHGWEVVGDLDDPVPVTTGAAIPRLRPTTP